jgi:hypothetical protein
MQSLTLVENDEDEFDSEDEIPFQIDYSNDKSSFVRSSIINQGDVYNERITKREALKIAGMDNRRVVPVQGWYDSLRETDDGRYTSITKTEAMENYA